MLKIDTDSIVELCKMNNELKDYVNNKIKVDFKILNKINDGDDFDLF